MESKQAFTLGEGDLQHPRVFLGENGDKYFRSVGVE
jgi:hypothetical protein